MAGLACFSSEQILVPGVLVTGFQWLLFRAQLAWPVLCLLLFPTLSPFSYLRGDFFLVVLRTLLLDHSLPWTQPCPPGVTGKHRRGTHCCPRHSLWRNLRLSRSVLSVLPLPGSVPSGCLGTSSGEGEKEPTFGS